MKLAMNHVGDVHLMSIESLDRRQVNSLLLLSVSNAVDVEIEGKKLKASETHLYYTQCGRYKIT